MVRKVYGMSGVVTERDEVWLRWMSGWRGVTSRQVARWWVPELSGGVQVVERRLRVLREAGLVASVRPLVGVRSVYWVTAEGLRFLGADDDVRAKGPVASTVRHDLAVVDCATYFHAVMPGCEVVPERVIRAVDHVNDPQQASQWRYAVRHRSSSASSSRVGLIPDFVSHEDGARRIHHEVEIAPKSGKRLADLMRSYALAPQVERVIYYVPEHARKRYAKAAEEANLRRSLERVPTSEWSRGRVVRVIGWQWVEDGYATVDPSPLGVRG